ncbi:aldo/keto reductase [Silvanigrella aquatica]|uniref:NADP-dependent oxidoreductase domain-containing protein n=1 Tax=Silvanigrella aquatica TaxID=1915309 RepID=A0A1L4D226_9BACT|nr:aldo/keto reductase [Silvanigrella aquatica]APJ04240.1 hypothetical protein AXG55_10105 [Silvanigrella aquatica]
MQIFSSRFLGNLKVSSQGLGCMGMSEFYGQASKEESLKTLKTALNAGINFFDTADIYGTGENELLIGEFIKNHDRKNIVVATKCGLVRDKSDSTKRVVNNTCDYIMTCCHDSLKRLQTDYIDIYYLHRIDEKGPQSAPLEESMKAFAQLWNDKKILHIGISEARAEQIERAHLALLKYTDGRAGLSAVQSEYSLMSRGVEENGVLDMCRKYGIGFVAYSPLSRQLLTDNLKLEDLSKDDFRHNLPRFKEENLRKNNAIILELKEISKKKNCTVAQLALAWVLAKGDNIVPIPGTKRERYLLENIQAANIKLTEDELKAMSKIAPSHVIAGERYTKDQMKTYNLSE